ncbi:MAG: ATP-dependent DNA helicase RecG [Cycloclasticus sp. symbiont of Poecilosclerida sp. M]|nr:MAG: ATP-dependent DNA helicase RecG [Cycloclasticus sp. symbiont of Poecilosclerida sp. M]
MPQTDFLDERPVTQLKGVGAKVAEKLQRLGIHTISDVLFHLPYRYEDRSKVVAIGSLERGGSAVFEGRVELSEVTFRGRRTLLVRLSDDTGFVTLRFFHFSLSQKEALQRGQWLRCFGEARALRKARGLEIIHPEYQLIDEQDRGKINHGVLPVYPVTEGLRQASLRKLAKQAISLANEGGQLLECLPSSVLRENDWPSLNNCLMKLHQPGKMPATGLLDQFAFKRLVFEELLANHLSLSRLKKVTQQHPAPVFDKGERLQQDFLRSLGFSLTAAQQRVIAEIRQDVQRNAPMQRLLQGDVGSGKTVVAACAALYAVSSGYQVALMAPTELLAEQHFKVFSDWLQPLGVYVAWLVGKHKGKTYQSITNQISKGQANVIIGTQALFQDKVSFAKLGLVIIDEQHRFGVQQRIALRDKADSAQMPHQLVMTATPIPRTLAMLGYADLDLSIIDELPPGRTAVTTSVVSVVKRDNVISRIEQGVKNGRQVYWVCTLIEESEVLQCQAAEDAAKLLQQSMPNARVGLIHGRLSADEKQKMMTDFKQNKLDVLVATTVIEVGVDVPNASLMVIENAERLGLAQLHQLRGRVGRGVKESHCVLLYQPPLSKNANERLSVLRQTTDGFKIAEEDMKLRGPGELLGKRQAGFLRFKIADMTRDAKMLPAVELAAEQILQESPEVVEVLARRWLSNLVDYALV